MKKKCLIAMVIAVVLSFVLAFVSCGPTENGSGNGGDAGGSGDSGDDGGNGGDSGDSGDSGSSDNVLEGVEKRDMVSVTGGTFTQKDLHVAEDNFFDHTISDFSIAKFEVTYELWYKVLKWATEQKAGDKYTFANEGREGNEGADGNEPTDSAKHHPVVKINWRDAIVWCNAYSELCGYDPVYKKDGAVVRESTNAPEVGGIDNVTADWDADGYRLPTEGEWQYAASYKDGTNFTDWNYASGATADYTDEVACKDVAWYNANSKLKTHPVGERTHNALGLHDMSGNVDEFCWDWWEEYFPLEAQTDYKGPATGLYRVVHGGTFNDHSGYLRIGYKFSGYSPCNGEQDDVGFRVARHPQ